MTTIESQIGYEDAWQSVRAMHQILSEKIGHELAEAGLPELVWFDVLARLEESDDPLRPRDLLCRVSVTKSGLTRLLDRIEEAGLIERQSCPSDRRGTWISMTREGEEILSEMKPIRQKAFADYFESAVSPEEAQSVSGILDRVTESVRKGLEEDGCCEV